MASTPGSEDAEPVACAAGRHSTAADTATVIYCHCCLIPRRKGYHELNSGTLQMLVQPGACSGVLFDYSRIPNIGTLVRGRVFAIGERSVTLETGAQLPFDYLVLAPGSTYADNAIKDVGGTAAERQALIEVRTAPVVVQYSIAEQGLRFGLLWRSYSACRFIFATKSQLNRREEMCHTR